MRDLRRLWEVMDGRTAVKKYGEQLYARFPRAATSAEELIDNVAGADPTTKFNPEGEITRLGTYSEWVIQHLLSDGDGFETQKNLVMHPQFLAWALTSFDKHRNSLPLEQRNIQSFKSFKDFLPVALPTIEKEHQRAIEAKGVEKNHGDYIEVPANPGWKVLAPLTPGRAKSLGAGTHWCTAGSTQARRYYKDYCVDEHTVLFIIVAPQDWSGEVGGREYSFDNKKWQTHLDAGGSVAGFNRGSDDGMEGSADQEMIRRASGFTVELQQELTDKYSDDVQKNFESSVALSSSAAEDLIYGQLLLELLVRSDVLDRWRLKIVGDNSPWQRREVRGFWKKSPDERLEIVSDFGLILQVDDELWGDASADLYDVVKASYSRSTAENLVKAPSESEARDTFINELKNYFSFNAEQAYDQLRYRLDFCLALYSRYPRTMWAAVRWGDQELEEVLAELRSKDLQEVRRDNIAYLRAWKPARHYSDNSLVPIAYDELKELANEIDEENLWSELSSFLEVAAADAFDHSSWRALLDPDDEDGEREKNFGGWERVAGVDSRNNYRIPHGCKAVKELLWLLHNRPAANWKQEVPLRDFWLDSEGQPTYLDLEKLKGADASDVSSEEFDDDEACSDLDFGNYNGGLAETATKIKKLLWTTEDSQSETAFQQVAKQLYYDQELQARRKSRETQPDLDLGLPEKRRRRPSSMGVHKC